MKYFAIGFIFFISASISYGQFPGEGGEGGSQGRKGAYGKALGKQLDNNVSSTCKNINTIRTARGLKAIPCGNRLGGKKSGEGEEGGYGDDSGGGGDGYGNY
jgi:hypothetical protein